jgi:large subunit ribosomal protein L27
LVGGFDFENWFMSIVRKPNHFGFMKFLVQWVQISVYPRTEEKVENPNSRRVRRREFYRERREHRRAYLEGPDVFEPSLAMASAEPAVQSDEKALC